MNKNDKGGIQRQFLVPQPTEQEKITGKTYIRKLREKYDLKYGCRKWKKSLRKEHEDLNTTEGDTKLNNFFCSQSFDTELYRLLKMFFESKLSPKEINECY